MSPHIAKLFSRPLALASVALVVQIGAASAADSKGDVQQQMKELLAGNITTHSSPHSGPRDGQVTSPAVDIQELTREYLTGTTISRARGAERTKAGASAKTEPQKRPVAYGDVQAAMRQVLLGQPHASDAPQLAARRTR